MHLLAIAFRIGFSREGHLGLPVSVDFSDVSLMGRNPVFERLMSGFHSDAMYLSQDSICGLWPDLTMAYFNSGWTQFAERNGGEPTISERWSIGSQVLDAMAVPIRGFFREKFERVLRERRLWEHLYECSSSSVERRMKMTVYPLGAREGLLAVHSLVQEQPNSQSGSSPLEEIYLNQEQLIVQCCQCRRVQRAGAANVWDWVPAWVDSPPRNTSHGLCDPCFGFYYADGRFLSNLGQKPFQ